MVHGCSQKAFQSRQPSNPGVSSVQNYRRFSKPVLKNPRSFPKGPKRGPASYQSRNISFPLGAGGYVILGASSPSPIFHPMSLRGSMKVFTLGKAGCRMGKTKAHAAGNSGKWMKVTCDILWLRIFNCNFGFWTSTCHSLPWESKNHRHAGPALLTAKHASMRHSNGGRWGR